MNNMHHNKDLLKIEEYHRLLYLLDGIDEFVKKHSIVSYIEFDYYVVHDMTLFSVDPNFDFNQLSKMIHEIKGSIPAIKRIFSKPIIILRDSNDVLPVENARIINQNTLLHLASHSQYVENITQKGVKPRKLLTRIYEDDYSIYENVVFCNFIDDVLQIIRHNRRILNSLLYASSVLKFNLLEKVNHLNYFLALGKLHTGYIRDFSQYFDISKTLLQELNHISKAINPRLIKPIYQKNKKRNKHIALKKTNIFLMQKDYKRIYLNYKHILKNQTHVNQEEVVIDDELLRRKYLTYVQLLTIFAIGHFNFEMNPNVKMNLNSLDVTFTFKTWELNIFSNNKKEIILDFKKEKSYRMMIVADSYDIKTIKKNKKDYRVDEMIVINQSEENYLKRNDVFISIQDVDSFRRIQQFLLKGMIYADKKRDICPFCGGKLHKDLIHDFYQCESCMTQIKTGICNKSGQPFYYTTMAQFNKHTIHLSDYNADEYWYYTKQIESMMYFRNITKINQDGDIICPHCHQIHKVKQ